MSAVEDAGIKVIEGADAECTERRVTGFARFDDPGGNTIEFGSGGRRVQGEQPTYEITAGAYWGHK